ncbi:putative ATPase [Sphingomonas faeni]|uniref:Putative ATPase n=1 Tax=Sphingomonas faeni TaxID=185950 RepID=A0A2T5UBL5_9SPHN|nr:AAA family ATPase [Sphingomonas faeni]PTW48883.1 putative ATPase [Sphingomonas faeni]
MRISQAKILSYASFSDSGWIEFSPTINVIVGENNSGKSALLSALRPMLQSKPHKSGTKFRPGDLEQSRTELDIVINGRELLDRLSATNVEILIPISENINNYPTELLTYLKSDSEITYFGIRHPNSEIMARADFFRTLSDEPNQYARRVRMVGGEPTFVGLESGTQNTIGQLFDHAAVPGIYYFAAQRLSIGTAAIADSKLLSENASNLPNVLAFLQGSRRAIFDEIQLRVREVLPSVGSIAVTPTGGSHRILIRTDPQSSEEELAFDLNECGTGVAQVIAILTAVITASDAVIIVDEINSFLHPAAVKRLISLFKLLYNKHQYIISTHSADTISASASDHVIFIERDQYESKVRRIAGSDVNAMRAAASRLGISMLDVFGYESVMWVEGPTEEHCFRAILAYHSTAIPGSVAIASVPSTGDFSRKGSTKKALLGIFEQTARAVAPLSGGMSFALDRDNASQDAVDAVFESTSGKLRLLPRYCIENYLLHSAAISEILLQLIGVKITPETVTQAISSVASELMGGKDPSSLPLVTGNEAWLQRVDGAKLMSRIFTVLSETKLVYRKVEHGKLLTEEILRRDAQYLNELRLFVEERLTKAVEVGGT